jgi:uncharacterized protein
MSDFLVALGLLLVLEGIAFAAFPAAMKQSMLEVARSNDAFLRKLGLACALFGLVVIWLVRAG